MLTNPLTLKIKTFLQAKVIPFLRPEPKLTLPPRMVSVDALRGLAIILLVFMEFLQQGGLVIRVNPDPMLYSNHQWASAGLNTTWLDLVLPLLLLALGISIAFSYHRSRLLGLGHLVIALRIIQRTLFLLFFAITYQAFIAFTLSAAPTFPIWLLSILTFGAFFLIFLHPRPTWERRHVLLVKVIGWLVIILLLLALRYPGGVGILLQRSDPLLILVTQVYCFSALLQLFTVQRWLPRLGVLGILLALRISYHYSDFFQALWHWPPLSSLFKSDYWLYLFIVVPGTIIGEILTTWQLQSTRDEIQKHPYLYSRLLTLLVFTSLALIFFLVDLMGVKVWLLTFLGLLWLVFGALILFRPQTATERELRRIYYWGGYWLILALILRPFAKAFPPIRQALSYYFLITGLAILLLVILIVVLEILQQEKLRFLVSLGENSLLAFTAPNFLLLPLLNLTRVHQLLLTLNFQPWWAFIRGLIYTFLLIITVTFFNRKKLFWRI